jgi:hypothetical protein
MRDQGFNDNMFFGASAMSNTASILPPVMFFFVWIAAFAFMLHAA